MKVTELNALKILAMRLRGMKGELEALGEESEGVEAISKIQTQVLNLTKGKVNIFDDLDPTKFKSTYNIMMDIYKVWDDLSQVDQADLLEIIAGKQRGNSIAALIQSMGQAQNVLTDSIQSSGSAMSEQEKYMQSIQYSIDKVTASWQEFSSISINSEWIKIFYEMASGAIQLGSSVGGLIPLLSILSVLVLSFNKSQKLNTLQNFAAQLIQVKTGAVATTTAVKALSFALSSGVLLAVTAGISLYGKYTQSQEDARQASIELTKTYKKESEELSKNVSSYDKLQTELASGNLSAKETSSIKEQLLGVQKSLIDTYGEEANKLDLVNGKYEDQIGILNSLSKNKAYEYMALNKNDFETSQDYLGTKHTYSINGESGSKLDKEVREYLEAYEGISAISSKKGLLGEYTKITIDDATIEETTEKLNALYASLTEKFGNDSSVEGIKTSISGILNSFDTEKINEAKASVAEYTKAQIVANDTLRPLYKESADAIEKYNTAVIGGDASTISTAKQSLDDVRERVESQIHVVDGARDVFDSLFSEIVSGTANVDKALLSQGNSTSNIWVENEKALNSYQKSIEKIGSSIKNISSLSSTDVFGLMQEFPQLAQHGFTGSEGVEALEKALRSVANELTDSLDPTLQMNELLQRFYEENMNASSGIDAMIDSIVELQFALEKVKSKQSMSLDEITKLTNKYPELAKAIIITSNGYSIEEDALKSLIKTQSGDANASITAQIDKTNKVIEQTRSRIEAYKAEASAIDVLVKAYDSQYDSMRHFLQEWGDEEAKSKFGASNVENYREYMKNRFDLGTALNELDKLKGQLSTSTTALSGASTKDEKDKKFSKEYDWISILKDTINSALKGLDELITYTQKNKQIDIAISAKLDEEKSLKEIQDSYLALADKVQLPDKYKQLINEGALNIETITDEALANKIDEYTKWKDAAKDVGVELEALTDDLKDLNGLKLDNIKSHFDVKNSYTNSKIDKRNALISSKEASGGTASKSDYNYLQKLYGDIITNLDKEYKAYETLFNEQVKQGIIRKGSTEYYEGLSYLNDLTIASREANIQVDELANKKIKLDFVAFDKEIENVNKQLSEIDNTTSFVDKDSIEQLTLYQTGLALATQHSKELTDEINALNASYSKNKDDIVYKERLAELETQMNSNAKSIQSYQNSIISSMKARYDKELKLSEKSLKDELKNIEKLKKSKLKALNDELKKYKEVIDLRKQSLKDAIEEEDYKEEVDQYTKDISNLESRITRLMAAEKSGDLSARQERISAEDELAKLKKDLGKLQRDYTLDIAIDALDAEYDKYEKVKNQQIADTESFYELQIEQAQSVYDTKAEQLETLYENERQLIIDAAKLTSDEFSKAFNVINGTLSKYGLSIPSDIIDSYKELGKGFTNNVAGTNSVSSLLGAKSEDNKYAQDTSKLSGLNKYLADEGYKTMTTKQMVELAKALGLTDITSASQLGTDKIGQANKNKIKDALMKARFAEGGIIGGSSIKAMGEDGLVLAQTGEGILKEKQWQLLRVVAEGLQSVNNLNLTKVHSNQPTGSMVNVDINLPANSTITPDALKDLNKFKKDIVQEVSKVIVTGSTKY